MDKETGKIEAAHVHHLFLFAHACLGNAPKIIKCKGRIMRKENGGKNSGETSSEAN